MSTLYQRLGGADGIARIVDDLVEAHLNNPLVGPRFAKVDLEHTKRMACEFFGAGAGGPQPYTGKDMVAAHKGMNISEQEFLAALNDTMIALGKNGIDDATKNEVLAIMFSLKGEIIRV